MGFETVVRPVVFPNIRPAPARALRIEDAPDKGIAVITGGSNSVVDLPFSFSSSWSKSRQVEVKRYFDKVRLYYTYQGTVDKSKYWDFEVLIRIDWIENGSISKSQTFARPHEQPNLKILERGLSRLAGF